MQIVLAHIGTRRQAKDHFESLTALYIERISTYARCSSESFRDENALFAWIERQQQRTSAITVLLDSRGRELSSEKFAEWLGRQRDSGSQLMIFAIGPADGWSDASHKRATLTLSLGQMTLAHTLARLVMAEQVYRAFTILTGHPYHSGH